MVGELDRREVPPENPVEEIDAVVGFLLFVLVADRELVRDREEVALVLAEQLIFDQLSAYFENAAEDDDRGSLGVFVGVPCPVQADGVAEPVSGRAFSLGHAAQEVRSGGIGAGDQATDVFAFVCEVEAEVASFEQTIDAPPVDDAACGGREIAVVPAASVVVV